MRDCLSALRECEYYLKYLRCPTDTFHSMIIVAVFCLVIAHPGPVFAEAESEGRIKALGEPKTNLRSEPATV